LRERERESERWSMSGGRGERGRSRLPAEPGA